MITMKPLHWILIIAGVVVVGIATTLVLTRRRKEQEKEDEAARYASIASGGMIGTGGDIGVAGQKQCYQVMNINRDLRAVDCKAGDPWGTVYELSAETGYVGAGDIGAWQLG
jgi:hypothetical protein